MKHRAYRAVLASLVIAPLVVVSVVEQIVWSKNPPVGEVSGLPSALLTIFTLPFILISGSILSVVLKLTNKGTTNSYLLAFIIPSTIHALLFLYLTIRAVTVT